MEREYWIRMEEVGGCYEISNLGRVRAYYWKTSQEKRNPETRIKKLHNDKRHKVVYWRGCRNGEQWGYTVASLVYKYFGDGRPDDRQVKVHHKDGDYTNNRIDNLFISRPTTDKVQGWQVDRFNQFAETEVKKIIHKAKRFYAKNIDPEEVEQYALMLVWENLAKLVPDEPFYNFAMRYCKFAYHKVRYGDMKFWGQI